MTKAYNVSVFIMKEELIKNKQNKYIMCEMVIKCYEEKLKQNKRIESDRSE